MDGRKSAATTNRDALRNFARNLDVAQRNSFAEAPTEHLVKSAADLRAYRYFHENTRYEPDYAFAERRRAQVGDMGLVLCYLPKSPLMQLIALDAGLTTVFEIFIDAGEEFRKTLEVVRRSHDAAAQIAVESPAEILMIPENLSSECVGKTFYEMFMRDYEETWARRIREAGKFSCIHLDGTMKGLLRETCSTSLTFIEALTPAPAGDLEIEKWAEWSGNSRTILWGGVPGVFFTGLVSDEEFRCSRLPRAGGDAFRAALRPGCRRPGSARWLGKPRAPRARARGAVRGVLVRGGKVLDLPRAVL